MDGSMLPAASQFILPIATLIVAVLCNFARQLAGAKKESVLRRLGIRLGDVPTNHDHRPRRRRRRGRARPPRRRVLRPPERGWAQQHPLRRPVPQPQHGAVRAAVGGAPPQHHLRGAPPRRRQEELYVPLIRACQERRRRSAGGTTMASSYVDTLLDVEIPVEGDPQRRRKLCEGDMVSLVSEYLGAATGAVTTVLEWALASLVLRPDIQNRLRSEVEAAACAYVRAVVMETLRRHPPVSPAQRTLSSDAMVGGTHVAPGTMVNFSLEDISTDGKIWTSPEEFIPERFMPGGEGADVRLVIGNKETTKVKMMPFGAGRRICSGMEYAILNLEYFVAKLVTAFEWYPITGEKVDLTAEYAFFTMMQHPVRARVVPRTMAPMTV